MVVLESSIKVRLKKSIEGDAESFWELIEPHRGLIYSVAFGILNNTEQAQDIFHEVYLEAFRSVGNLRKPEHFPAWLRSLTRNQSYVLIQKEIRERNNIKELYQNQPRIIPIDELLIKEKEIQQLEGAIKTLPEHFREVLSMKYMNHYSCKQIAEILEVGVEAVKSRLFEARKLLRNNLMKIQGISKSQVKGGL